MLASNVKHIRKIIFAAKLVVLLCRIIAIYIQKNDLFNVNYDKNFEKYFLNKYLY